MLSGIREAGGDGAVTRGSCMAGIEASRDVIPSMPSRPLVYHIPSIRHHNGPIVPQMVIVTKDVISPTRHHSRCDT